MPLLQTQFRRAAFRVQGKVSNLETKIMEMGKCPVCRGTTKQPDGRECRNCGGQTMTLRATGKVPLRKRQRRR
jgi:rRNA maturation endonuclease Nob1